MIDSPMKNVKNADNFFVNAAKEKK